MNKMKMIINDEQKKRYGRELHTRVISELRSYKQGWKYNKYDPDILVSSKYPDEEISTWYEFWNGKSMFMVHNRGHKPGDKPIETFFLQGEPLPLYSPADAKTKIGAIIAKEILRKETWILEEVLDRKE